MITVHIIWFPLIETALCWLIAWILNGFKIGTPVRTSAKIFTIFGVITTMFSLIIYSAYLADFAAKHLNIVR